MVRAKKLKYRRWANTVAIFVGLYVLAWAIWTPLGGGGVNEYAWWGSHALAGLMTVIAPFMAFRVKILSRMLLVASGCILLLGLFSVNWLAMEAILSLLLPGVALLAVSPFMGPMPSEVEERKAR
jgi:hypothetical protein